MKRVVGFPATVNENSARLVATGVVAMGVAFLYVMSGWILVPLVYGFAARVVAGPTFSPLGQFATKVATPFYERFFPVGQQVPGPPKRFAQSIGLTVTTLAAIAWLLDLETVAVVLISGLVFAAGLEMSGFCLACPIYEKIWGCEDCDDISRRVERRSAEPVSV